MEKIRSFPALRTSREKKFNTAPTTTQFVNIKTQKRNLIERKKPETKTQQRTRLNFLMPDVSRLISARVFFSLSPFRNFLVACDVLLPVSTSSGVVTNRTVAAPKNAKKHHESTSFFTNRFKRGH